MRKRTMTAVLVCGALVLGACGGDDDDDSTAPPAGGNGDGGGVPTSGLDIEEGLGETSDLPEDVCKAFPADKVEAIVPGATMDGPTNMNAGGMSSADCGWANDTRTLSLHYTAGIPHEQIKMSMEGDTKDANGELTKIGGADAGIVILVTGDLEINMVKGDVLIGLRLLTIDGPANTHRAGMLELAEAAVGSL